MRWTVPALLSLLALLGCAHGDPEPSNLYVTEISPADGETGVSTSGGITITFSEAVHPDPIEKYKAILVVDSGNVLVRGSFTVSENTVTFSPSGSLAADETYGVAVRTRVVDTLGRPLRYPKAALFSTGSTVGEISGFPPFDEYPEAPDVDLITAWSIGPNVEVTGQAGCVAPYKYVNVNNLSTGGAEVTVQADFEGGFTAWVPGQAGNLLSVSVSDVSTGKTGPAVTVTALVPLAWTQLAPGAGPSGRYGHSAVYDPVNRRMVVFGGSTVAVGITASDEVWSLSLSVEGLETWSQLSPATGPNARLGHGAVYDGARQRMIVFGGNTGLLGVLNDVWALSLATPGAETWTQITPLGTPPSARAFMAMVYDQPRDRVVVFGGEDAGFLVPGRFSDVWALSLSGTVAWTELYPDDPLDALGGLLSFPPRSGAASVYDPLAQRMLVLMGHASVSGLPTPLPDGYGLSLTEDPPVWSTMTSTATTMGRGYAASAYDSAGHRVLVFGGRSTTDPYDDLFELSLADDTWTTPDVPVGTPPEARSGASAVWDTLWGRFVLFGGTNTTGGSVFSDVHQLK